MALKGIKVLELAGLAPAPYCGMVLADFGASVIRVDKIGANVDLDCLGNGKKSISLNLKHPKGQSIFKKLCKSSDVLIEPFRKGVMESLGLGPDVLLKENTRLVYARLTGFGQSGPYSSRAGHDINFLSLSGLLSLFGRKGENPFFPANLASDFGGGGLLCAFGITAALLERERSGKGQVVDNSMVHGTAYLGTWLYRSQKLPIWGNERGENILDSGAHFYETYKTKDNKYMAVGALEPQFYKILIEGLGVTLEDAPQFGNFKDIKDLFKNIFLEKTQAEWCKIFDKVDACVTPVLSLDEAPLHEHNKAQQCFLRSIEGDHVPAPAPKLSRTPAVSSQKMCSAKPGEHTREILQSLNFDDSSILKLQEEGIIEFYNKSKL